MRWKHLLLALPVLFAVLAACCIGGGEDATNGATDGDPGFREVTPESAAAAEKGLAWLAARQESDTRGALSGAAYPVAVTSLACLAFMADGDVPGRGKYGENVKKCIHYLLRQSDAKGFISEMGGQSRMHGHGFATLALVEAYGMTHISDEVETTDLKERIQKAIRVIETSQSNLGGWYYMPDPRGDEASITICCVQALRAARNAGFTVNLNVIKKGVEYIKKCRNRDGSFRYSLSQGSANSSFALTAGAVASLAFLGQQDCEDYKAGIDYMMKFKPPRQRDGGHYFYENFYAVLAMFYAGNKYWSEWYPAMRDDIVKQQDRQQGFWQGEISQEYCTAFACLMLEVPYRYLPIYQR